MLDILNNEKLKVDYFIIYNNFTMIILILN